MKAVVVIPTLNEAEHVGAVIATVSEPLADGSVPEILVIDGLSPDGTADVARGLALDHVRVIDNPDRTQAHAVNLAARWALGEGYEVLLRADCHAGYPPGFVAKLLATLEETGADSVVVPMRTVGGTRMQDAAALLYGSALGNGGSRHRTGAFRGYVDHGHHAAFKLETFLRLGGYDTDFLANEDAEYDWRLMQAGGKIFMENAVSVDYIPRPTLTATFRQFRRNGTYRVRRAVKHRLGLGLRQAVPAALVPVLGLAALLGLAVTPWAWLVWLGYFGLLLGAGLRIAARAGRIDLGPRVAALAAMSHLGFSAGASREGLKCAMTPKWRAALREDGGRLIGGQGAPDRTLSRQEAGSIDAVTRPISDQNI